MNWRTLAIAGVAMVALARLGAEEGATADLKKLQGTWTVVAAERDGQPLDRIKGGTLTVSGENFHIKTKNCAELKGDLRLEPLKKPKTMDLAHQEGLLRDKTWLAIYQLDGDDLKICYAEADSNKDRPTEFKTEQDSGTLLVVLRRKDR